MKNPQHCSKVVCEKKWKNNETFFLVDKLCETKEEKSRVVDACVNEETKSSLSFSSSCYDWKNGNFLQK